jgi:hypothetical protein
LCDIFRVCFTGNVTQENVQQLLACALIRQADLDLLNEPAEDGRINAIEPIGCSNDKHRRPAHANTIQLLSQFADNLGRNGVMVCAPSWRDDVQFVDEEANRRPADYKSVLTSAKFGF